MQVLTLILIGLISRGAIKSMVVSVESARINYSINLTPTYFEYQSSQKKIQRPISKCDTRAFELFSRRIENVLTSELTMTTFKTKNSLDVKFNKKQLFIPPMSRAGNFLVKINTDVDYLISEAIYRCSKK